MFVLEKRPKAVCYDYKLLCFSLTTWCIFNDLLGWLFALKGEDLCLSLVINPSMLKFTIKSLHFSTYRLPSFQERQFRILLRKFLWRSITFVFKLFISIMLISFSLSNSDFKTSKLNFKKKSISLLWFTKKNISLLLLYKDETFCF